MRHALATVTTGGTLWSSGSVDMRGCERESVPDSRRYLESQCDCFGGSACNASTASRLRSSSCQCKTHALMHSHTHARHHTVNIRDRRHDRRANSAICCFCWVGSRENCCGTVVTRQREKAWQARPCAVARSRQVY